MSATRPFTVAIDGPAGAGKSTVSRRVAMLLGYSLVDTGAIYRAVALLARRRGVAWDDEAALAALARELRIEFRLAGEINHVLVDSEDVTEAIRTPAMSMGASAVSALPEVRAALLELQRRLAGRGGAVLEGRDIGTVVYPRAEVKVFLDASPEERARRRQLELEQKGVQTTFAEVLADLHQRDQQDSTRAAAPLRAAADALVLDSTRLSIDEVIARILAQVER